jgi:hypothetical protein
MRIFPVQPVRVMTALTALALVAVVLGLTALRKPQEMNPFDEFRIEAAATSLVRVTSAAGIPDEMEGIYFVDVNTGDIDGWYDPKGEMRAIAVAGDSRLVAFRRGSSTNPPTRNLTSTLFLADRKTGAVYTWPGDAEIVLSSIAFQNNKLAALDDRLLMRIEDPDGDDWFALIDVDAELEVVTTFRAPAYWGWLAADGERTAVFWDRAYIADLRTGRVKPAGEGVELPDHLFEQAQVAMRPAPDGFLVVVSSPQDRFEGSWRRYAWSGQLLAEGRGRDFLPSPDGTRIAVSEPLIMDGEESILDVLNVLETSDAALLYRVIGVRTWFGGYDGANRWLADNSGVAVSAPRFAAFAMADGTFRSYPGLPSPASPSVFAQGPVPLGLDGKPLLDVEIGVRVRDFVPPWDDTGKVLHFETPHGGHDGPYSQTTIVRPWIDTTGRGGPVVVELEDASGTVELRDSPAGRITGQLPGRQTVVIQETLSICSSGGQESPRTGCGEDGYDAAVAFLRRQGELGDDFEPWAPVLGLWARVTTGDGTGGWVLVHAVILGI